MEGAGGHCTLLIESWDGAERKTSDLRHWMRLGGAVWSRELNSIIVTAHKNTVNHLAIRQLERIGRCKIAHVEAEYKNCSQLPAH